jgi:hypothetical protein
MHPEVTGKKGSECPECGMELTEKVAHSNGKKEDANNADEENKM